MTPSPDGNGATLESRIGVLVQEAGDRVREGYVRCEAQVRQSPSRALLAALGAGYLLRNLPIAELLSGLLRLVFALVRPLAFLLCAAKLLELVQNKAARTTPASRAAPESPRSPFAQPARESVRRIARG